jgi:hypothetical protein
MTATATHADVTRDLHGIIRAARTRNRAAGTWDRDGLLNQVTDLRGELAAAVNEHRKARGAAGEITGAVVAAADRDARGHADHDEQWARYLAILATGQAR